MSESSCNIVVGFDGSADADSALAWGAHTANLLQGSLAVVIVATDRDPAVGHLREADDHAVELWRTQAFDRLKELDVVHHTVEVRHGPVVPELVRAAEDAEMLIVGSRGHGFAAGMLAGSTSQHAARHATCPVVAVRPCRSTQARRIAVGVDGSPESDRALRFACNRARATGESVVAVYCHYTLRSRMFGPEGDDSDAEMRRLEAAERFAVELTAGVVAEYPDVEIVSEAAPVRPGRLLTDYSRTASLVVVGSRGRDAFAELLLGSVSQHVLQHAECPVAIVR